MKGLIIKSPWIDKILAGEKVWEIRSKNTSMRGKIALIKSGTGLIFGTVELIDSIFLSPQQYFDNSRLHCVPVVKKDNVISMPYHNTHAWVLTNPVLFDKPIPYTHPQGAVIWVNLELNIA